MNFPLTAAHSNNRWRSKVGRGEPTRRSRLAGAVLIACGMAVLLPDAASDCLRAAVAPDGVYIPNPNHKFAASQNGLVSHSFRIYNMRPHYLALEAQPDCGCTGVSWKRASVAPFRWKDITATVEAREVSERKASVLVALHTDLPNHPWLFVSMQGNSRMH